ncbi:MAG: hypothetical protein LIO57_04195 [Oscillospiraceae bacterium]|nr:hypothetical protein [Oscillospiraceae bacterium]
MDELAFILLGLAAGLAALAAGGAAANMVIPRVPRLREWLDELADDEDC